MNHAVGIILLYEISILSPVYLFKHERFGSVRVLVSNRNAEYCVLTDACLVADVVTITGSCYVS